MPKGWLQKTEFIRVRKAPSSWKGMPLSVGASVFMATLVACTASPRQVSTEEAIHAGKLQIKTLLESEIAGCEMLGEEYCSSGRSNAAYRCLLKWKTSAADQGGNAIYIVNDQEPREPFGQKYSGLARLYRCPG